MELLLAILGGILVGIVTGIFPGLGLTSALILAYPIIKNFDPVFLLVFYGTLICSVQYFGSVVGIYLGVPGEINSLIASKIGFKMMHKRVGGIALGSTAIASLFAATVGIICFYFLVNQSQILLPLLSVKVQAVVIFSILAVMLFYSANSKLQNFSLIGLGLFLSTIGYNNTGVSVTFGTDILQPGLNSIVILMMLYVIPNMLLYWDSTKLGVAGKIGLNIKKSIGACVKNIGPIFRGTILGSFSGLIPGVGPVICSNMAASLESRIKKYNYSGQLVAAESSNNSAILISLIPFIGLGLVILPHEAIIYDILINNGNIVNVNWINANNRIDMLFYSLILANVLCFLIAWPASNTLVWIYKKIDYKHLVMLTIAVVSIMTFYQSHDSYRLDLDIMSTVAFVPLAYYYVKKKIDSLPLIFSYMLGDQTFKVLLFLKQII